MDSMVAIEEIAEGRRISNGAITNTIQMISPQMTVIDVAKVDGITIPKSMAVRRVIIAIGAVKVEVTTESEALVVKGGKTLPLLVEETTIANQMIGQALTKNGPNTITHQLIIHIHHVMKVNKNNISIGTGSHPTTIAYK